MQKSLLTLFAFVAALFVPAIAFAAQVAADTDVLIVPPEVFQAGTIAAVAASVGAAVLALIEKFLGPFGFAAKLARLDNIIAGYVKGGLSALIERNPELARRGISVDVGNAFVAAVARDIVRIAPGWLLRFAGGKEEIEKKIRNRLPDILKDLKLPAFPGALPN
jgi:hypothetical protein